MSGAGSEFFNLLARQQYTVLQYYWNIINLCVHIAL